MQDCFVYWLVYHITFLQKSLFHITNIVVFVLLCFFFLNSFQLSAPPFTFLLSVHSVIICCLLYLKSMILLGKYTIIYCGATEKNTSPLNPNMYTCSHIKHLVCSFLFLFLSLYILNNFFAFSLLHIWAIFNQAPGVSEVAVICVKWKNTTR